MGEQDITTEITDLKPGNHICCFYQDEKEHEQLVTSYIKHGLEKGEKVVYILDRHDLETVKHYLEKAQVDVDHYTQKDQLVFYHSRDTYTRMGCFEPDLMIKDLEKLYKEALEQGYPAVRGSGEMSWILNCPESLENLLVYENGLNHFLEDKQFYALCQYDVNNFDNKLLLDILFLHPKIALANKILNNFYYIPTSDYHGNNLPESTFNTYFENLMDRGSYEQKLQHSRRRYKNLFENSPIPLWEEDVSLVKKYIENLKMEGVKNFEDYFEKNSDVVQKLDEMIEIVNVNQKALEFYGANDLNDFKNHQPGLFTPESIKTFQKALITLVDDKNSFSGEAIALTFSGDKRHVLVNTFTSPGYEKDFSSLMVSVIDISHLIIIEDRLKKANHKNEMLLKEIHHRMKNNMQIISSILSLQSFFIEDENLKEALNDCKNRVRSMGFIHEKLYQSGDFADINMYDYVNTLAAEIFRSYSNSPENVKLEIDIPDIKLNINQAIPTALILNELLSNSIKYAFPEGTGKILIGMKEENNTVYMIVEDDGIGFPPDFEPLKSETLGLQLVGNLVSQLGGSISLDRTKGTKFLIVFPKFNS
ncbi:MAG: MEDS domain-containing protein [Methanobacteriaceae archaeon]|nr:MEDS domain-containing protein [Methanobacteriaceae archaeon]